MTQQHEWWQQGIIYQIYPRSFQDSNGDGVGDLPGILSRLDYLEWLGVDAVWLSPIYPSPMADFGYDISDYVGVDPIFGTLADFDQLIAEVHRRGMKLVLDFVPNHTSDQHAWFKESRSSRDNPKRDWYIWRDPAPGGGPPNNWLSNFGGDAWELDPATGQYYYHAFLKQQPDLNWRNPDVQQAMLDVLRFWLDRGVDGFRVDVIWHIVKDDQFRDNLPDPAYKPTQAPNRKLLATYNTDRPEVHDIIGRMRKVLDEYGERMMVGEIYLPLERMVTYYGVARRRRASAVQFSVDRTSLARPRHRRRDRPLRSTPAIVRLAQLGTRKSRQPANRDSHRPRPGTHRRDAAADASRHADAVLRRRDRHAQRGDSARSRARPVREERARPGTGSRPVSHADAMVGQTKTPASPPRRHGCRSPTILQT